MNSFCYYCPEEGGDLMKSPCKCKQTHLHKQCYYIIRQQRANCFYCNEGFPPFEYEWSADGLAKVYKFKKFGNTIHRHQFTINRSMEKHGTELIYDDIAGKLLVRNEWMNGMKIISDEGRR